MTDPTITTTIIAIIIDTPSSQSILFSSPFIYILNIDMQISINEDIIRIIIILSEIASSTKLQKVGRGFINILLLPKYSSLFSVEDIPFFLSVSNLFNKFSMPPCSSKYFISSKLSALSLYKFIICINSWGDI